MVRIRPVPCRIGEHVKKLLVLAAAIAGFLVYRKAQESEARKTVWSKSTDTVD
ncbi:DLW-39 family protein [Pseudarthrobacter sp. CC12]|uniref:DLW-39 family protein n=1 Tax=Pseudarthrobacter sp. NIBRBAC000502770 TaxID=2590785 RepID=UPI001FEF97A9|nr:DLW-39 family protein [Pseudarthrobacter sp. NIBRBAC000502770]